MHASMTPAVKPNSNHAVNLSDNPCCKSPESLAEDPSVNPAVLHISMHVAVNASEFLAVNPSVNHAVNPSVSPAMHPLFTTAVHLL